MSRTTIKKAWKQIWKCYLVECPYLTDSIQSFAVLSAHFLTLFLISCSLFRFLNRLFLLVCELFLLISTRLLIVPLSLLVYQSFLQGSACSHLHSFTICFYSFISRLLSFINHLPAVSTRLPIVYTRSSVVLYSFTSRLYAFTSRLPVGPTRLHVVSSFSYSFNCRSRFNTYDFFCKEYCIFKSNVKLLGDFTP